MLSHIDGYSQVNIELTKSEAKELYRTGKLEGSIRQISGPYHINRTLPLRLKVSKNGWRAEGIPRDKPFEKKKSYKIDMPPDGPKKILKHEIIGSGFPTIRLRKIYISLEDVY